jgi:hypothetical protein
LAAGTAIAPPVVRPPVAWAGAAPCGAGAAPCGAVDAVGHTLCPSGPWSICMAALAGWQLAAAAAAPTLWIKPAGADAAGNEALAEASTATIAVGCARLEPDAAGGGDVAVLPRAGATVPLLLLPPRLLAIARPRFAPLTTGGAAEA